MLIGPNYKILETTIVLIEKNYTVMQDELFEILVKNIIITILVINYFSFL